MELKRAYDLTRKICRFLLIVPYGIETVIRLVLIFVHLLLIVPYGIETTAGR